MYSSSGGGGNAARIYNPRPDPLERGPPKRVNREESHIGEMVAASKKRISWTFTLGDSETVHEVVLVHSIMSYKKVVEYDGRQMHYSATATPGDWSFVMILDGTNNVIEVRINDLESAEVPKYDLVIDRIPFRRWDVFRRSKAASGPPRSSFSHQSSVGSASSSGGTFGQHRWGPGGVTAPKPSEVPPPAHQSHRPSAGPFGREASSPPPAFQHHASTTARAAPPAPAQTSTPAPPKKQPEINLIDDFAPAVSVSAQQLLFDPLASSKIGVSSPPLAPANGSQAYSRTSSSPSLGGQFASMPMANTRTASNPMMQPMGQSSTQPYVDPFANIAQPAPIKPTSTNINLDPFAAQGMGYNRPAAQPQPPGMPTYPMQGQPPAAMGMGMGMAAQPRGMPGGVVQAQPGYAGAAGMPQQAKMAGAANFNISHLMNPMEVNNVRNAQQTKTIDIDPFAVIKPK
ncbi:hypothetical protein PINS_up000170 [Pythium insidiosum]|nr:hypothetical protein PINS_up000170 [Pythium insidiosum]